MKDDHRVAIVVLNFNGWRDTLRCLASLRDTRFCKRTTFIVDNGSSDNSPKVLRSELQRREILVAKQRNEGFPGGINTGLRFCLRTDAEYYFLVNNDTVVEPEVLHESMDYMDHNRDVGVAGPKVHRMSNPDLPVDPALAGKIQPRTFLIFSDVRSCSGQKYHERLDSWTRRSSCIGTRRITGSAPSEEGIVWFTFRPKEGFYTRGARPRRS